jgi:predicted peroxiredoxin
MLSSSQPLSSRTGGAKVTIGGSASTLTLQQMKNDPKFGTLMVNVNVLETLYRDYFKASDNQQEVRNRCFKHLYNLIEESATKCFELYVDAQAAKCKTARLEDTIHQLELVFSSSHF